MLTDVTIITDNCQPEKPDVWLSAIKITSKDISRNFKGVGTKIVESSNIVEGKSRVLQQNYYHGSLVHNSIQLLLQGKDGSTRLWFNGIFRLARLHLAETWEEFIELGKNLTNMVKQAQDIIGKEWYLLVDLQLIAAYQLEKESPTKIEAIDWLHDTKDHSLFGDITEFEKLFEAGLIDFWKNVPFIQAEKYYDIDTFISNPALWATSGSSMRAERYEDSRKNKWTLAYNSSKDKLRSLLLTNQNNEVHVFVKTNHEPIKNRFIGTCDDPANLQMSFLDQYISPGLKHCNIIASYMSNKGWISMYDLITTFKRHKLPSVDVDQTNFDHGMSRKMVEMTLQSIYNRITLLLNTAGSYNSEVFNVIEALKYSMSHLRIVGDNYAFPWTNGVASGWRWTALLDSMINWAENKIIDQDMLNYGLPVRLVYRVVQGDDVSEFYMDNITALNRVKFWQRRNFDISVSKTIVNKRYSEFLRYIINESEVRGYPARVLHSILVRDPTTTQRNDDSVEVEHLRVCATLASRNKINIDDIPIVSNLDMILHLPSCYGGVAAYPIKICGLKILPEVFKTKSDKRFYGYQLQRMGIKNSQKVRKRKIQYMSSVVAGVSNLHAQRLFKISPWHYDLFYDLPDQYDLIDATIRNPILKESTLRSLLAERSKLLYDMVCPYFTRKMRFLWLSSRLPVPTITGLYHPRIVKEVSDDLIGRLLHFVVISKFRIGVELWERYVVELSTRLPQIIPSYHLVDMTE